MSPRIKHKHCIGDVLGDYTLLDYLGLDQGSKIYKIKCNVCGRTRNARISDLRHGHGQSHKHCSWTLPKDNYLIKVRRSWADMRNRTTNPKCDKYKDYGGRGITSDDYKFFINFYDDMYESCKSHMDMYGFKNTTLERIDVNGNYEKNNIKWATWKEQHGNTRRNKKFETTHPTGEKIIAKNQTEFAKEHNIDFSCINLCLNGKAKQVKGWTFKFIEAK
jgi:hypothetical protein